MNICQNEIQTSPSKTLEEKTVTGSADFTNNIEKDLQRKHLQDITTTNPTSKVCSKCNTNKPLESFHKGVGKFGRRAVCKKCMRIMQIGADRKYYQKHKKKINIRKKEYRQQWFRLNAGRIYIQRKHRKEIDTSYKIACNLRCRMSEAIKNDFKCGSSVKDLGCSIPEFKKYIESKFQPGMTWENWGRDTWHLDHITPLSWFNLEDRNQFLISAHYSNYQPLWAVDNWSKYNN